MSIKNYDDWKLATPPVNEKWEKFLGQLTTKEENKYRNQYQIFLINEGWLDDDLEDYDEDEFWEWVYENKLDE